MKKIVLAITALLAFAFDLSAQRYIDTSSIVLSHKYDFERLQRLEVFRYLHLRYVSGNPCHIFAEA